MKRVSLARLDQGDLIEIIMASPAAGAFVAQLKEESVEASRLASYTVVYTSDIVCLRVPHHQGDEGLELPRLFFWMDNSRVPVRVDSPLLPRDAVELRQMARASSGGPRGIPNISWLSSAA